MGFFGKKKVEDIPDNSAETTLKTELEEEVEKLQNIQDKLLYINLIHQFSRREQLLKVVLHPQCGYV